MKSTLNGFSGLYRSKKGARSQLGIDLAAVRAEALARAKAEGRTWTAGEIDARIVAALRDDEALDPRTRMGAALALAQEQINERRSTD